jgi:hypothetical protein
MGCPALKRLVHLRTVYPDVQLTETESEGPPEAPEAFSAEEFPSPRDGNCIKVDLGCVLGTIVAPTGKWMLGRDENHCVSDNVTTSRYHYTTSFVSATLS